VVGGPALQQDRAELCLPAALRMLSHELGCVALPCAKTPQGSIPCSCCDCNPLPPFTLALLSVFCRGCKGSRPRAALEWTPTIRESTLTVTALKHAMHCHNQPWEGYQVAYCLKAAVCAADLSAMRCWHALLMQHCPICTGTSCGKLLWQRSNNQHTPTPICCCPCQQQQRV
jgi:hypothetical protein